MSECVVRMEMPSDCERCPMCGTASGGNGMYELWCMCGDIHANSQKRPEDCPIICQLPEGHGRLVDASVLKNKNMRKPRGVSSYDYGAMATVFMDTINDTPTIVPAEAKRKVDAHDAVAPTDTPTDTPTVAAERSET